MPRFPFLRTDAVKSPAMLREVFDPIVSILYPQACHSCGGPVESAIDGVGCAECWAATRIFDGTETLCRKCGALLSDQIELCRQCGDAHFDLAVAVGIYERALAATVVHMKKFPHMPKRATHLLINAIGRVSVNGNSIVIPVPLSKRRKFERGHNQAEILARLVSRTASAPIYPTCLIRTAHSPIHRMAMDKKAREITVKNAFDVHSPRVIAGHDVILVDDVLTSGATASACARILKKNGANKVTVVTLARAV